MLPYIRVVTLSPSLIVVEALPPTVAALISPVLPAFLKCAGREGAGRIWVCVVALDTHDIPIILSCTLLLVLSHLQMLTC